MTRDSFLHLWSVLAGLAFLLPVWAETPLRQAIDAEVRAAWQKENLAPAGPADDAAWRKAAKVAA
jgi:hypothetical protein